MSQFGLQTSRQHQTPKGNSGKSLAGIALSGDFRFLITLWHVLLEDC